MSSLIEKVALIPNREAWRSDPHSVDLEVRCRPRRGLEDTTGDVIPDLFRTSFRRGPWQFHPCHLKDVEDIAGDVMPGLEIPVAIPLVYGLDADLKPIPNKLSSRLMAIPSVPS